MTHILSGLRVVEGSAFIAAPSAGLALAQLGADVIRFDPIGGGLDYGRWPIDAKGNSLYWAGLNKGKRSIQIDLKRREGRELAQRLITAPGQNAGLFLTNFPAAGWLDYDELRKRRPDLVMVNIMGNRDGSSEVDYTVNPATGIPHLTGPDGYREPVNHVLPAWDLITGMNAAFGLLAAERRRRETGEGQLVKVALSDVAFATMGNLGFIAEEQVNREEREPVGNDLFGAFGRDFGARDGRRVMIVAITGRQWRALVEALDLQPHVTALEARLGFNLDDEGARFRMRDEIARMIQPWCAARTLDEISAVLTPAGVSWGPYQTVRQALAEDARISAASPLFAEVAHPAIGQVLTPRTPLDFSRAEARQPAAAPKLGAHTDEVLAGVLGLSDSEIGKLHDGGVVA
jgi:2-methylfumaryl-CoA isomerase